MESLFHYGQFLVTARGLSSSMTNRPMNPRDVEVPAKWLMTNNTNNCKQNRDKVSRMAMFARQHDSQFRAFYLYSLGSDNRKQ